MRTFLRGKVTLLFMMLGLLLAIPAVALADQIGNNLDAVIDATVEETSVQLGGPAGSDTKTVGYLISPEGPGVDGDPGCNLDGSTEKLVANVTSSDASVATVSPSQVTFSGPGCGSTPSVTVTGKTPGTATITLTESSNNTGGTFGYTGATFQVNVDRATSITDVSGEGTEGGTVTLKATLNSLYTNTAADPGPDETAGTVAGKDISFKLGGTDVGTATTGTNGVAEKTFTLPATYLAANSPYVDEVSASFARVAGYAASGPVLGDLIVNPPCTAPSVTTHPSNQTVDYGDNASFTAAASGDPTPSVQWQVNTGSGFTNISGANNATLSLTKPPVSASGNQYRAVFTNSCGTATSDAATLTVNPWTLNGFYPPVDMGIHNTMKGGQTVALKFEVLKGSTELTNTNVIQTFTQKVNCTSTGGEDAIEQFATGNTELRYDSTSGQFIFNWKSPKSPGTCYRVKMTTEDNSSILADFTLK